VACKIVVIGSSNTDMVVKTERIPAPGETMLGGEFVMVPGGKGANQAVAAARLGADVTFVARVGDDAFGRTAIQNFEREGINTSFIVTDPRAASGIALIIVDKNGENSIAVAPGANMRLTPDDVLKARGAIEQADIVVLQFEVPMETVEAGVRLAKECGAKVLVNPAPAAKAPPGILPMTDVLTPNRIEAATLLNSSREEDPSRLAGELLQSGVGAAIITLGSDGVLIGQSGERGWIPAVKVDAVDTTAAGDAFTGALAVGLADGSDLKSAAQFAVYAAAASVTRMGAQSSLPTREEVEKLIAKELLEGH